MSSTPEIKSSPFQKFSPVGIGISKTLLTPCRRVGLSRKRGSQSTPISITKTQTGSLNETSLKEDSLKKTPVGYEQSFFNGKQSQSFSKNKCSEKIKFIDNNESVTKNNSCKKVLAQKFSLERCDQISAVTGEIDDFGVLNTDGDTVVLEIDEEKEQYNSTVKNKNNDKRKLQNFQNNQTKSILEPVAKMYLDKIKDVKIEAQEDSNSILVESNSNLKHKKEHTLDAKSKGSSKTKEKMAPKKRLNNTTVYDSDDDFIPIDTKSLRKRKTTIAGNSLKKSKSGTLKECNVSLERLDSEMSIKAKSFIMSNDENLSDNEFIVIKKEKHFVIKDVNVSINSRPKSVDSNPLSKVVSNLHEDDEDMAFTSTPEQEKNEKKKLINLITDLEKEVIEKKKRLEDLKQASIYKNKHNIEELCTLTERWKTGCESGIKSLLRQLQAHGPMDIATLLKKLHIPDYVVAQLSLGDTFS